MSISLDDLKAKVRAAASGGNFSLTASQLGSAEIDALSANVFPDGTIKLSGAGEPSESDGGNAITVVGTGVDLPFAGMAVEIKFFLAGGDAALSLTATGDAGWKLQRSFPVLSTSVLAGFSFLASAPPRLRLDSQGNADAPAAVTFEGLLDLNAASAGLASLIGRTEQPLTGANGVQKSGKVLSRVELTASVSEQVNLIIVTVEKLTFTVGSDLVYNALDDKLTAVPYVGLGATFPFSAQGQDYGLPVAVRIADFGRDFRFSADVTSAIDAGLQEISKLTNDVGLGDFIPPDFKLEDVIKLDEFFFDFSVAGSAKLTLIGVGVSSAAPWKILHLDASDKDLQAENVRLSFRLRDPFGTKQPWLALLGDVRLGDAGVLEISSFYPNFSVEAALKEGTILRFDELMRDFVGADASIPPINVYALMFKVSAGQFSLLADMQGFWAIGDSPVAVEAIRLEIENGGGKTRAAAAATFSVAGVDVSLSAQYLGAAGGWIFEGSTGAGQAIPIGRVIEDLAGKFGGITLPGAVADLVVENLKVRLDTGRKEFAFGCESKFRADDTDVDITVNLTVKDAGNAYTKDFAGTLKVGGYDFTLHFVQNAASDLFVATYRPDVAGRALDVKQLVASVSSAVAAYVPEGLSVELKDVLFAYGKTTQAGAQAGTQTGTQTGAQATPAKLIFGLDIGTGINLSNLPLVGQEFPKDATVGVDDLQILFISQGLAEADVTSFNNLIPDGVTKLPVPTTQQGATQSGGASGPTTTTTTTAVAIQQGFNVSAKLNFGGSPQVFSMPSSGTAATTGAQTGTQTGTTGATTPAQASDGAKWFALQKTFGPVYFEKVGVQYQDAAVWFLLNASLSAAGLTLSLDGLGVGSAVDKFDPKFKLRGLGVDYKGGGAIEIGGSFLRVEATAPDGTKYDEYDGAAVLKAEAFTLSAIGSYAKLGGHPSLFVYAVLDYPLGGPSFFFVTGLAAGFGYNRALVVPSIDKVAQFPLVSEAVNSTGIRNSLTTELQNLRTYIPPTVGETFLAVGVKFTSFKLIDSFVLLTVSFGTKFEVNVLGLSTLVVPTPEAGNVVTPLAEVQMAVKATYRPDDGFLGVQAQLTAASYLLSRNCKLTGGFAFYSWVSGPHKGEFVQTLGGYHPSFRAPDYYPQVPRLGFNWRVDSRLTLKGEAYYALTASALMAGGLLQATWDSGDLKARFTAAADFVISWKPYHYDAKISIEASVSYTFNFFGRHTINVDVGARLHIWGPEFAGTATIDISVISFDVSFGSGKSQTPQPISWGTFKGSFLPADDSVCGISLKGGLVSVPQESGGVDWVVNPKEFVIVTDSVIPAMSAFVGKSTTPFDASHATAFGVGSMAVTAKDLSTSHTVTIRGDGGSSEDGFELKHFDFEPVLKRVPVGLWGQSLTPSIKGQAFVEDALTGFEIRPKDATKPGVTADIPTDTLRYDPETVTDAYAWDAAAPFVATADDDAARREAIRKSLTGDAASKAREQLLSELGVVAAINLSPSVADSFTVAPLVEAVPS